MRAFFSKIAGFFRKAAPVVVKAEPVAAAVIEKLHPEMTGGISMAESVYRGVRG